MTRVLVIDDHPIVIQGCRRLLEDMGVDEILGAEPRGRVPHLPAEARHDHRRSFDAVGRAGRASFIRRLRLHDERTPVLVFSMHSDPVIVSRALEVGANGYLLKDTSSDECCKAFQRVREGRPYLSHELASEIAFREARGMSNPLSRMSLRELQTLSLIAEGKPYIAIAEELMSATRRWSTRARSSR